MKNLKRLLVVIFTIVLILGINLSTFGMMPKEGENQKLYSDLFVTQAIDLMQTYWEDSYFSSITLEIGESIMRIDGEEREIIPAVMDKGTLYLPIIEIAEAVGADANVNEETGEIKITTDENEVSIPVEPNPSMFRESSIIEKEILSDGTIILHMPNGTILASLPLAEETQLSEVLGLEVHIDGNIITLTKPYQMKQLIVRAEENLTDTYGAIAAATDNNGLYLLQYATESDTRIAEESLRTLPYVQNVMLNKIAQITATLTDRWGAERIETDRYQTEKSIGSSGEVVVAVLDTGVDVTHELIAGHTVAGYNFTGNDTSPDDDHGHGTHVSGIVVDSTPDNVKIMPIKVMNNEGRGDFLTISFGIAWAKENGAHIINMSLGGYHDESDDCPIEQGVAAAIEAGVTVVVSAGNDNKSTDTFCPAKITDTITVAATDTLDRKASFSNYGNAIDIAAPGVNILSSTPNNTYASYEGTSMAAPYVAAAVAIFKSEDSTRTPAQLKERVQEATVDCGTPGWDSVFGAGVLDFGILLGDNVSADSYGGNNNIEFVLSHFALRESDIASSMYVGPVNATDKSVVITSTNENVAIYENGKIVAVGAGEATINVVLNRGTYGGIINWQYYITVSESNNWIDYHADSYAGGTGTEDDPYLIATAEQLAKLSYDTMTNIDGKQFSNTYFKLTADIDLAGKEWTPIMHKEILGEALWGNRWVGLNPFLGHFDGNYHEIKNMRIQQSASSTPWWDNYMSNSFLGLFGCVTGGSIRNLAVTDANVTGRDNVGILAGWVLSSFGSTMTIENCYTSGTSTDSGFIGQLEKCNVINCYSTATAEKAGFTSYVIDNSQIINSFAVNTSQAGYGFTRSKSDSSTIKNCYYLNIGTSGIGSDENPTTTDLTVKEMDFFKTKSSFTDTNDIWDEGYLWDFGDVWGIDSTINGGYPFLKGNKVLPTHAETPNITVQPSNTTVKINTVVKLEMTASVDKGTISYQWYENKSKTNTGGTAINGATGAIYDAPTSVTGTKHYYCIVTNTDTTATGNQTATATSDAVSVTVIAESEEQTNLKGGTVGIVYSVTLPASNNSTNWRVSSGSLPTGLRLDNCGVISGTPTTAGIFTFDVIVTNEDGSSVILSFCITIAVSTPATGIADVAEATLAMFVFLVISAALWSYILFYKYSIKSNNG